VLTRRGAGRSKFQAEQTRNSCAGIRWDGWTGSERRGVQDRKWLTRLPTVVRIQRAVAVAGLPSGTAPALCVITTASPQCSFVPEGWHTTLDKPSLMCGSIMLSADAVSSPFSSRTCQQAEGTLAALLACAVDFDYPRAD
jgi:hypothetical protein